MRGGVAKKIEGEGNTMPERGKEDKICGGGGSCEKNLRGGYSGEEKEDKMCGGCEKILRGGGMPERVKKTKCGGGGCCEKD